MINHFRTWLLNRPAGFFADSLFPVHTEADFKPSPQEDWMQKIDGILFGTNPDASLVDYRFFQFLRVISGCHFGDHVLRFDPRETYRNVFDMPLQDSLFESSIVPMNGLTVTEFFGNRPEFLRKTFTVLAQEERMIVLGGDGRPIPITALSNNRVRIDSLGLTVTAEKSGSWRVDYRMRPRRSIDEIVRDIDDLPVTVLRSLFDMVREIAPEYEEGFRAMTDSLSRFCMILFAVAIANEQMQLAWEKGAKRIDGKTADLSINAEGCFYFGLHPQESLRFAEMKSEFRCLSAVRNRRQTLEMTVPQMAYLYLVWPLRFGLPARNRIVVDGLLNSAWDVSYTGEREEQYVVFRSEYKIRTDTPVRIEIP